MISAYPPLSHLAVSQNGVCEDVRSDAQQHQRQDRTEIYRQPCCLAIECPAGAEYFRIFMRLWRKNKRKDKEQKVTARLEIVRQITMFRHDTLLPQSKRAQDRAAWGLKVLLNIFYRFIYRFYQYLQHPEKSTIKFDLTNQRGTTTDNSNPQRKAHDNQATHNTHLKADSRGGSTWPSIVITSSWIESHSDESFEAIPSFFSYLSPFTRSSLGADLKLVLMASKG